MRLDAVRGGVLDDLELCEVVRAQRRHRMGHERVVVAYDRANVCVSASVMAVVCGSAARRQL